MHRHMPFASCSSCESETQVFWPLSSIFIILNFPLMDFAVWLTPRTTKFLHQFPQAPCQALAKAQLFKIYKVWTNLRYCCLVHWSSALFLLQISVFQGLWVISKSIPFFFSLTFLFVLFFVPFSFIPLLLPSSLSRSLSQAAEPSWLDRNVCSALTQWTWDSLAGHRVLQAHCGESQCKLVSGGPRLFWWLEKSILVGLSAPFLSQEVLLIRDHGPLMCLCHIENEMLALFCVVWEHNWFKAPRKTSLTHWLQGRFELMADVCFLWWNFPLIVLKAEESFQGRLGYFMQIREQTDFGAKKAYYGSYIFPHLLHKLFMLPVTKNEIIPAI